MRLGYKPIKNIIFIGVNMIKGITLNKLFARFSSKIHDFIQSGVKKPAKLAIIFKGFGWSSCFPQMLSLWKVLGRNFGIHSLTLPCTFCLLFHHHAMTVMYQNSSSAYELQVGVTS